MGPPVFHPPSSRRFPCLSVPFLSGLQCLFVLINANLDLLAPASFSTLLGFLLPADSVRVRQIMFDGFPWPSVASRDSVVFLGVLLC